MEQDTDLIARVYAYPDRHLLNAVTAIQSTQQYIPAPEPQELEEVHQSRSSRESTAPPEESNLDWTDKSDHLELRFSRGPRTSTGLIFGADRNICDVAFSHPAGISKLHFALTYKTFDDGYYRLILRDLGSRHGTTVLYGDEDPKGLFVRHGFDWIIHGFPFPDQAKNIVIKLFHDLKFLIIVAKQNIASPTYVANVERFLQGSAAPEDLVGALGLYSGPQTGRDTLAHTPISGSIIIPNKLLGGGAFGVVTRCWNVSTGDVWACKRPRRPNLDQRELQQWAREIEIMKSISHKNIVKLHDSQLGQRPFIYMEYVPLGNLADAYKQTRFSIHDLFEILHQSASALAYLHEQPNPICHRDIKPENILVQSRHPLHIKLSDFGLSKAGDLKTMCGTYKYMAPEVVTSCGSFQYTAAADIWSLGVVILQFTYGLPFRPPNTDLYVWCRMLRSHLEMAATYSRKMPLLPIMEKTVEIVATYRFRAAYLADLRLSMVDGLPVIDMPVLASIHDPPQEIAPLQEIAPPPQEIAPPPQEIAPPLQEILPPREYLFLDIGVVKIAYHPSAKIINASHLIKLKKSRHLFDRFFNSHDRIVRYVRTTGRHVRGTYISFQDVERFCNFVKIDYVPIRQIILASIAEPSHNEDDHTIRAPAVADRIR